MLGLPKGPGDSAGWGKGVGESHVAIEENDPEDTRAGSVFRRNGTFSKFTNK